MENISNQTCRICNSSNLKKLILGKTELINCSDCGIYYQSCLPESDVISDYYKDKYKISGDEVYQTEKRRIFRLPEQVELISEIQNYKPSPAKILDIGCDKGYFLDEARRYGYEVCGIEPSQSAREYCTKIGIIVDESLDEISDKFDVITMWHSLEHHLKPLEAIKILNNYITKDGYLFIRVPAFDSIWRKILGHRWIWFQPQNHYFYFTYKSLTKILQLAGFEIIKLEHRKPNTRFTRKMNRLVNSLFGNKFAVKVNLKNILSRKIEDITGVAFL